MPNSSSAQNQDPEAYSAKDIEVLEGLEPVRHRPGMYIGGTDERALHHLFAEVLDNSMDEAVAGHASWIDVHLEADGFLTVSAFELSIVPFPSSLSHSACPLFLTIVIFMGSG